jgi:translation initiation factor 2 alpha subunit (eIF-2alpha)
VPYVRPRVYDVRVENMHRYFKVGDRVVAHVIEVDPDREYIEVGVGAKD